MNTSDIIALILIVFLCLTAIGYFIIKSNGKNKRVSSIIKSYPGLAMVLLDREALPTPSELSEEQSNKILSLSDSDWSEWDILMKKVGKIAIKYPYTLYEFITDYFPKCKERVNYKKNIARFTPIPKRAKVATASLLLDELRTIDADSENSWKERDDLRLQATNIRQNFPEGYKTYCSIHELYPPQNRVIVNDKKQIAEFQKLYNESKGYEGWEKKQEDFSKKFRQILDDLCPQAGKYPYEIPFNKPTDKGAIIKSKFKVWQGFCRGFSSFLLDRQTDFFKEKYNKLVSFRERSRYFYDSVYDDIFKIIKNLEKEIQGQLCVVLIDRCKLNRPNSTYEYHYRHISELIDNSDFLRCKYSDLYFVKDEGNIGGVFILDFITSNDELMNNCRLIIEYFKCSVPFIGYYSMMKEYDENELLAYAETNEGILKPEEDLEEIYIDDMVEEVGKDIDEENDKQFLKNCILQVNKLSCFSYLAVPNGWIGSAVGANNTKKTWLQHPERLFFQTKKRAGFISGEYSLNGGKDYMDLSIEGDPYNIDDVTNYTYILFRRMGVLNLFKTNGYKAISHMNKRGYFTK